MNCIIIDIYKNDNWIGNEILRTDTEEFDSVLPERLHHLVKTYGKDIKIMIHSPSEEELDWWLSKRNGV